MTLSGFDDGSSTAFPRLVVWELHASGSTPRFTERPESPDFSSFSNTGFQGSGDAGNLFISEARQSRLFQRSFEKEARLLG